MLIGFNKSTQKHMTHTWQRMAGSRVGSRVG